jgi:hypothetical protein
MLQQVNCECGETTMGFNYRCTNCGKFRGKTLQDILIDLEKIKESINEYIKYDQPNETKTKYEEKYNELLYAVGTKYPNETRHETALRYIKEAEQHDMSADMTAKQSINDIEKTSEANDGKHILHHKQ